jgi:thioesterase domain-containing protein/malonyl CoA-acyl carrier protein transacylase
MGGVEPRVDSKTVAVIGMAGGTLASSAAGLPGPDQRRFIELARAAWHDAGGTDLDAGRRAGVYTSVGVSRREWREGEAPRLAAGIADALRLGGPAVTLAAAGQHELPALASACMALLEGDCDLALAGEFARDPGVAGAVVLKRLVDAVAAGDTVHGVLAPDTLDRLAGGSFFAATAAGKWPAAPAAAPSIVFMFPGGGTQYANMGRALYESEGMFRKTFDECAALLAPRLGIDIRDLLFGAAAANAPVGLLAHPGRSLPALFSIEYATAQQLIASGVRPGAMVGHSLGEYVAATLAGVFTLEDGLNIVAARGRLIATLPEANMLAVLCPAEEIERRLDDGLWLACVNGRNACTVSGTPEATRRLAERLDAEDIDYQLLESWPGSHSGLMEPVLDEFREVLRSVRLRPPAVPYLSNLHGDWITPGQATDPEYWVSHLRHTVQFASCLAKLRSDDRVYLEVGPGHTLSNLLIRDAGGPDKVRTITTLPGAGDAGLCARRHLVQAVEQLWCWGGAVDWRRLPAAPEGGGRAGAAGSPVPVRTGAGQPALFMLYPGPDEQRFASTFANLLAPGLPVYLLDAGAQADGDPLSVTVERMVAAQVRQLRQVQAQGPYRLLAWGAAGAIARQVAVQLIGMDQHVDFLGVVDMPPGCRETGAVRLLREALERGAGGDESGPLPVEICWFTDGAGKSPAFDTRWSKDGNPWRQITISGEDGWSDRALAAAVTERLADATARSRAIDEFEYEPRIVIQSGRNRQRTLFCVPGAGASVTAFTGLAQALGRDVPLHGLQPRGLCGSMVPHTDIASAARAYIRAIREVAPTGPYRLLGHSFGGWVATEIARQLVDAGEAPPALIVIDSDPPSTAARPRRRYARVEILLEFAHIVGLGRRPLELAEAELAPLDPDRQLSLLLSRMIASEVMPRGTSVQTLRGIMRVFATNLNTEFRPLRPYPGPLHLALASETMPDARGDHTDQHDLIDQWRDFAPDTRTWIGPGNHMTLLDSPQVDELASWLQPILHAVS